MITKILQKKQFLFLSTFSLFFLYFFLFVVIINCKDYYQILGIPKNANKQQIKRSFRKLAMKYHPDRNKGNKKKQDKFVEISKAYDVLIDDEKRKIYDRYGEEGLKQGVGGRGGGFHFNPNDIFQDFFGGGSSGGGSGGFHFSFGDGFGFGGGNGQNQEEEDDFKGEDIHIPIIVSLEDLYNSKSRIITRVRTAHKDGAEPRKCECHNKVIKMMIINGQMKRVVENKCPECKNRFDTIQKTSELMIDIEKGMKDNDNIVFYGEGDASREHRAGDLIFVLQQSPHPIFKRDGDNLSTKMDISLKEALSGFTKHLIHLDGKKFKVESDFVIKPGYVMELVGKGMPNRDDPDHYGNLYIKFNINFPEDLTQTQKKAIKNIL